MNNFLFESYRENILVSGLMELKTRFYESLNLRQASLVLISVLLLTSCQSYRNISHKPIEGMEEGQTRELTLLTYNIRTGIGTVSPGTSPFHTQFWKKDLPRISEAIRSTGSDIIAVQELLEGQEKELGRLLGMNYAYVRHGIAGPGDWWGVGVL